MARPRLGAEPMSAAERSARRREREQSERAEIQGLRRALLDAVAALASCGDDADLRAKHGATIARAWIAEGGAA